MLKPIYDRLLIRPLEVASRTASGLFIPETGNETLVRAEILSVGKAKPEMEDLFKFEVGQIILFDKNAGRKIQVDNEQLQILNYGSVFAVDPDLKMGD
jgi:chaperonin GroES